MPHGGDTLGNTYWFWRGDDPASVITSGATVESGWLDISNGLGLQFYWEHTGPGSLTANVWISLIARNDINRVSPDDHYVSRALFAVKPAGKDLVLPIANLQNWCLQIKIEATAVGDDVEGLWFGVCRNIS